MSKILELKEWYETYEKKISIFALLSGFIIDSLTLQRIDALRDNLWIALNLLAVGVCIALINRKEGDKTSWEHFSLITIIQFSFGALRGPFFIFYFRSAALTTAWPFLLVLLAAIVANELFQKRYAKLAFQLSFFYLSIFSFTIYLLPVIFHRIGVMMFLLSGAVSLGVIWLFVQLIIRMAKEKFLENKTHVWRLVLGIFVGMNVLYFTNLIPPIPLSMKDAGVYHSISKSIAGNYIVETEDKGFLDYFRLRERVHWTNGEALYAYSAIFSPGALNTQVVHEWQFKNNKGDWVTATRIPLYLSGGREDGFRTYSTKANLTPGPWRVNVETPRGALIGRINFEIISAAQLPNLMPIIKQ